MQAHRDKNFACPTPYYGIRAAQPIRNPLEEDGAERGNVFRTRRTSKAEWMRSRSCAFQMTWLPMRTCQASMRNADDPKTWEKHN